MREQYEIVIALRMQRVVQILKKNTYFATNMLPCAFNRKKNNLTFRALGVESRRGGAITKRNELVKVALAESDLLKMTG